LNRDHQDFLNELPANSYDAVYFDPMFQHAYLRSTSINAIRPFAVYQTLQAATIKEALRVARKRVVMKETARNKEFYRLEPTRVTGGRYSPIAYAIWEK
jgi:hypothetical protein